MKCSVEQQDGTHITKERIAVCSEDFCDTCGDCLVCFGEDDCLANADGNHIWVKYKD